MTTELRTSTLADFGRTLPIGIQTGNPPRFERTFAFKPFKAKQEEQIEKARKGSTQPGEVAVAVLSVMLTDWGGDDHFAEKSEKHRLEVLRNAPMSDVFYAYFVLRVEALGSIYAIQATCPKCEHEWPWDTDLNGLSLTVGDGLSMPTFDYTFKVPVEYGTKVYHTAKLVPPPWRSVCAVRATSRTTNASVKRELVRGAMISISSNDPNVPALTVGNAVFDEIDKRDIEALAASIDKRFPSLDAEIEIECPNCGHEQTHQTTWAFDFFFGTPSLPSET